MSVVGIIARESATFLLGVATGIALDVIRSRSRDRKRTRETLRATTIVAQELAQVHNGNEAAGYVSRIEDLMSELARLRVLPVADRTRVRRAMVFLHRAEAEINKVHGELPVVAAGMLGHVRREAEDFLRETPV